MQKSGNGVPGAAHGSGLSDSNITVADGPQKAVGGTEGIRILPPLEEVVDHFSTIGGRSGPPFSDLEVAYAWKVVAEHTISNWEAAISVHVGVIRRNLQRRENDSPHLSGTPVRHTSYPEWLRHPKWQRKRLEVNDRAGWKCEACGCDNRPLEVHHLVYHELLLPWESPMDELEALCNVCHEVREEDDVVYGKTKMSTAARAESRILHRKINDACLTVDQIREMMGFLETIV